MKYSYTGAPFTVITGVKPPWTTESRVTGHFVVPELPPNSNIDFLDPDIDFPFVNLPKEFSFSDGARSITHADIVNVMKNTGDRIDPTTHEVRAFSVSTDADGNVVKWDMLFVHDVRRNTFLTAHNGGIYGQDLVEVDATHFGCVATEKCTANANYTSQGSVLPDTQSPGKWTKEPWIEPDDSPGEQVADAGDGS
jgi:hypothetical protein